MWEFIKRIPRGRLSTRSYIGFVPALLVASFLYILFVTPTVHAADATRKDDTIVYGGKTYKPAIVDDKADGLGLKKDDAYYVNLDVSDFFDNDSAEVSVLTFPAGSKPKTAKQAEFRTGKYDSHDNRFTGLSPPKIITIGTATDSNHDSNGKPRSSCDLSGVGWIICPLTGWIADGVDFAYSILSKFFIFSPLTTSGDTNSIYMLWSYVRNIANICFIIAFLIVIYSQMTSGMMSNYTVKKILPRIIVAAILVNTSYWICAIGVDISNILGISIQDFLTNLRGGLGAANTQDFPTWSDVTTNILAGSGLVLGTGAVLVATGGTVGGLIFLLLGALIPAIFSVLVAVAILAARQALITVFIVIAPLAFVAYLLPNTEEWFNRWRKLFMTMLIMFPAFSLIFGASQLVGIIIIQNATDITVALLGMTVQVVPLFITPFLIKLSSGLLGTIAGMTNDRSKGVFDRTKNWASSNRELHRQRGFSKRPAQTRRGNLRPTVLAQRMNQRSLHREQMTAKHKAKAEAQFAETARGRQVYNRGKDAELRSHGAEAASQRAWTNEVYGANGLAHTNRAALHHAAHIDSGQAKLTEERATAHAERDFQTRVSTDAALRNLKVQTDVDTAQAQFQASNVEAEGKAAFKDIVLNDRNLRLTAVETNEFNKRAELAESVVQARADVHWNQLSNQDVNLRNQKLEQYSATQSAKQAEEQWNTIITNMEAVGSAAPNLKAGESRIADTIQKVTERLSVEALAKSNAETEKKSRLTKTLLEDTKIIDGQTIREYAGGVRDDAGAESVLATAIANTRKEYIEKIGEKGELAKHFNLSSEDRQKLALGSDNVQAVRSDGTTYTFKADDDYTREAMIDSQLKTGSFGNIEAIIGQSGVGGTTYEYADSISQAIASNGLAAKGLYFGSRTIDDVAQGRITGEAGLNNAVLFHVGEGKVKDDVLAAQSPGALKRLFELGANPALAPDFAGLSQEKQTTFIENALALRDSAGRILADPILLSRTDTASRKILEQYKT